MTIKIGKVIKKLRTERNVTQDMLANALSITPQAISRWESGTTYPDLEFLPVLADYFSVTTDELLGYKLSEREQTLVNIKKECDRLAEAGSVDEQIIHARQALIRYPFDFELKTYLAGALYCQWESQEDAAVSSEIIALCESVLKSCHDIDTKYFAVITLCSLYGDMGKAEKAYEIINANLVPMKYCRETVLSMGFDDEKSAFYKQDEIDKLTDGLGLTIQGLVVDETLPNDPSTWDKKIEMLEIANKLYHMIYGEDLMFYHERVADNHRLISTYQIAQGKTEEALLSLEKMQVHTLAYDKSYENDHGKPYSSILLDKLTYPYPSKEFHETAEHNQAFYMSKRLTHKRYDTIHHDERFASIIKALQGSAK